MNALTEKSLKVFNLIKTSNGELTLDKIAAELGEDPKSINGTLVALQRKKFIERVEAGTEIVNGKAKIIKFIQPTPIGMSYDHDAAMAQDVADKEAEAAAKAAAKAAKQAQA